MVVVYRRIVDDTKIDVDLETRFNSVIPDQDRLSQFHQSFAKFSKVVTNAYPSAVIKPYGSFAANVALRNRSDLDLSVKIETRDRRHVVDKLHQTLYDNGFRNITDLAFDLSLSALLGENIYNFGELLAHPIIKSLLGTKVEWLYYILESFNSGDLVRYQELCRIHNASLSAQPTLVGNEKKLLEKINILCLMEIIFSRPSEDRTIPLSIIANRTKLTVEDVEYLLMKSLLVHLIEGIIDQVEGTVHVSWVQPRVLGIPQIKSLCDRLDGESKHCFIISGG